MQFEITQATRDAVQKWIKQAVLKSEDFVFPSRIHDSPHLGTRQYARILEGWVEELGRGPVESKQNAKCPIAKIGQLAVFRTRCRYDF